MQTLKGKTLTIKVDLDESIGFLKALVKEKEDILVGKSSVAHWTGDKAT